MTWFLLTHKSLGAGVVGWVGGSITHLCGQIMMNMQQRAQLIKVRLKPQGKIELWSAFNLDRVYSYMKSCRESFVKYFTYKCITLI